MANKGSIDNFKVSTEVFGHLLWILPSKLVPIASMVIKNRTKNFWLISKNSLKMDGFKILRHPYKYMDILFKIIILYIIKTFKKR